ncbi:Membrane protein involved in the export of O-antigen and teichoic acid [[Clostridium] aminophilum]|uniref:Membrane protein involved in the export of O-antigen and teichoic acid n=1 Tax=[Clostridium] aminophilum TaxID=1526 RepID=A0A1I0B878_9FIRM|nr:flippase [[Clostridium] aminophilum]SET02348.1 Membrane protein involved in the export of O-antigen and teichoic acid [[Clostridium] aminophilum]
MKSVSKNYIYNTAYNVLNVILPLITAPYLARILGTDGVGTYAFYFAIAQWFALFAKLGLTNYGTRHLASVRDDSRKLMKDFSEIYVLQICMTIFVTIFYLVFVCNFAKDKLLAALFGIWVISVSFDVDWLLFGLEDFRSAAVRSCIVKLISTVSVFLIVQSKGDIWKYTLISAFSYAGGYLYLWLKCRRYLSLKEIQWENVIKHIKPCLLLMIPVIALSIYRTMDKVMLGSMSTMSETGLYEYAEKLIYALCSFISSFGTVMMPRMSNLAAKKDKYTSEKYMERSIEFIMFLSAGMCFGLLSVSNSLIPILYGDSFLGSIPLLNLLSVTLIFIAWGNVIRTQYVIPNKKDNIYIGSITIGAICNLLINAMLIPKLGAVGACIGTIVAELLVPIYQFIKLCNDLPYRRYLSNIVLFFVIGIIMCTMCKLVELVFSTGILTMIVQIITGVVFYVGISIFHMKKVLK